MKRTQMTGLVLVLLAGMASAATLQMQVVGSAITGVSDGSRMWDYDTSTPISWVDQTGNGHNADGSTAADYYCAFYQAPESGVFNEHAYVSRNSTSQLMGSCSFSDWGFTGVVVGSFTAAGQIMSFANSGVDNQYTVCQILEDGNLQVGGRYTWRQNYGATTDLNLLDGAEHVFVVEYRADDDMEVFIDGTSVLTFSTSIWLTPSSLDRYGLGIAADSTPAGGSSGNIAEARYYTGAWSANEREAMEQSLGATYGISVVPEPMTMGVLMIGGGLAVLRRRRNRRA